MYAEIAIWKGYALPVRDVVIAGGLVLLAWSVGRLARWGLEHWCERAGLEPGRHRAAQMAFLLGKPVSRFVTLGGCAAANRILVPLFPMDMRIFPPAVVRSGLFLLGVLTVISFLRQFFRFLIESYIAHAEAQADRERVAKDFAPLLQRVLMVMVYLAMTAMVLHYFKFDISSIVVSMGIGTVAVGLAAQDTLSNMIAGFFIMFDRPFRIGDRIELENKTLGDVVDIGLRTTRIQTLQNTIAVLPNAFLSKSQVINHSYPDRRARVELSFTVAFGADIARVAGIFAACAAGVPEILADPGPDCLLTGSSALGLQFAGGGWVSDYTLKARATNELAMKFFAALRADGVPLAGAEAILGSLGAALPSAGGKP